MRRVFLLALLAGTVLPLGAVKTGDTYEQVVAEKGKPAGTINRGAMQVLNYSTESVKLKNGKVVAVTPIEPAPRPRQQEDSEKPAAAPHQANAGRPAIDPAVWTINYQAARAQAQQQKKQIFLFFTGSDWCTWCQKLEREVLFTPEFERYAAEKLILVKLDYPKTIPQPEDLKRQNHALGQSFNIKGFPTCIVLDPSGNVLGELGYKPGGPKPFVAALDKL